MAPARMITSEQTLARIGRLMKVSTIMAQDSGLKARGSGASGAAGGRRVRRGRDRRAVQELLRAGDDDLLPGLDAFEHRIVVADDRADLDRALMRDELAVLSGPSATNTKY